MKYIIGLFAFVLMNLQFGCKSSKLSEHSELYEIEFYKIPDRTPKLVIEGYDDQDRNQKVPFAADVNGVVMNAEESFDGEPVEVYLVPGKFNISVKYLGKQTVKIEKLRMQRGDSVRIRVWLKTRYNSLH